MKSKSNREAIMLPGQLTIWDIEITERPKKVTETVASFTKIEEKVTKIDDSFTELQGKVIERYKVHPELNRIIYYCGGGVGIDLQHEDSFKTIYVNKQGIEEFSSDKKIPVLPMDKILYYKSAAVEFNSTQEQKLKELMQKMPEGRVIKRKADDNILIQFQDKVISINPLGWVLEFKGCKAIYTEDEVQSQEPETEENIKETQKVINLGDIVEAWHGKRLVQGEIVRVYGPSNVTLNIVFDNGTKHTAIHRSCVTKLFKCT